VIVWVSLENVCKPCEEGGLGVKETRNFNSALLAKWKWRLLSEAGGKWKEILISIYGSETGRSHVGLKYQSWWWRDLAKVCGEGDQEEGWFRKDIGWKVGDGSRVKLWEYVWLQSSSLKSMFSRLYSLSLDQGKRVGEVGTWEEGRWRFQPNWRRERFEWESKMEK